MTAARLKVRALAEDVFGSTESADRWLNTPLGILGSKTPLEVACSETGASFVAGILAKIDWGAAA